MGNGVTRALSAKAGLKKSVKPYWIDKKLEMYKTDTMKTTMVQRLIGYSHIHRSTTYRVVSFSIAVCVFMILLPIGYVWIGGLINQWLIIPCPGNIELILAGISGVIGVWLMMWTIWVQWTVGRGGPVPIAPTRQLITAGPYALCRNPMHLGALFYVFSFGLIFGNLVISLICIALETILLVLYLKGIEEKELLLRFGEEYEHYKEKTPFLIPCFRKS